MSEEKMFSWNPDICIYHGGCDDGFGAAWAIWKRWPTCQFVPGFYGKPLPDVTGKDVLFVDFSAKRPEIDRMANSARSVIIIDHHKTAEADLEPFRFDYSDRWDGLTGMPEDISGCLGKLAELNRPPVVALFDMQCSGAVMAWEFAHGIKRNDPPPTMLALVQDRDLWRFAYGDRTRQFSAALRTYPMDFDVWNGIARDPDALIAEGAIVLRAHQTNVRKLVAEAYIGEVGGFSVPIVNAPYHYASDVAHALLQDYPDAPFTACWFRRSDGKNQWSLRSEDDRRDVSEVAKANGGGGHRNAAGFEASA